MTTEFLLKQSHSRGRSERHHLEIRDVRGDGDDPHGVGVAQSTLPSLNGNDGGTGLDDLEVETLSETIPDSVIHLPWRVSS